MKKLLLLLLFAVSFTAVAQKTYSIDRQLQLENVAKGIKKDSVLVRGSDKIVRYIPRSEFGGGGSQNLDQTLAIGNTAINKDLIITKPSRSTSTTYTGEGINIVSDDENLNNNIGKTGMVVTDTGIGQTSIQSNMIALMQQSPSKEMTISAQGIASNQTYLQFDDTGVDGPYYATIQNKTGTIALLSDIPSGGGVQSVTGDIVNNANPLKPTIVSTGLIKTTGNQTKEGVLSFVNTEFSIGNKIEIENHDYYGMGTGLHINNKGGKGIIIDHTGNRAIEVNILPSAGYGLVINNRGNGLEAVNIGNFGSSDGIVINNISGTSARGLLIGASGTGEALVIGSGPEQTKDTVLIDNSGSGTVGNAINITSEGISVASISKTGYITHKPAITSDQSATLGQITTVINARTVQNTTTTALTATVLNTTYSTATAGFRVIASLISGGGLIYEKISTGWIKYAVTTVP